MGNPSLAVAYAQPSSAWRGGAINERHCVTAHRGFAYNGAQKRYAMKLIKTDLRGLNALQMLTRARVVRNAMKNNPLFPSPTPSMPEFEAAMDELAASIKITYSGGSRLAFSQKQTRLKALADMIKSLAAYVSIVAKGDNDIVLAAGFEQRRASSRINVLAQPKFPKAKSGQMPRTTEVRWDPVHGARMYKVLVTKGYLKTDGAVTVMTSTKSRCCITDLEPLEYYTVQVQALGAHAESALSTMTSALSVGHKAA